ncbi:YitT family protein [Enterococcus saccharolyticus]|uniref:YitT family protein n=1 Tax=Enterococcus saccharolyticus TaxID=41997 RepID=UPI0039E1DB82
MKKVFAHQQVQDALFVIAGAFVLAVSINCILLPNQIVAGGANGISVVLNHMFGWNVAVVLYAINIPLLILCFLLLGKEVGLKTIFGSLLYPFFVGVTAHFPVITHDLFLAALFGGIVTGVGLGLVFRGNASTGGTAIISQIVHKYFHVSLGIAILFVDGLVILSALIAFDTDVVLFSLISLFLIGRVVDMVQVGFDRSKNVMIVSQKYEEIQHAITTTLDKGATLIPIEGGYSQAPSKLLMTVISEKDFPKVKEAILTIDETAFFVTLNASEVNGRGFSLKKVADDYGVEVNHL